MLVGKEMLNAGCCGVRELFGQGLRMGQDLALGWTKPSSSLKLPLLWPMAMWARCSPLGLWLLLVRSLPLDYVSSYLRLCVCTFCRLLQRFMVLVSSWDLSGERCGQRCQLEEEHQSSTCLSGWVLSQWKIWALTLDELSLVSCHQFEGFLRSVCV